MTNLDKVIKAKFSKLSNQQLIDLANSKQDFKWDDEGYELNRRKEASNGKFNYKMTFEGIEVVENEKFARRCDATGEGMNEGWMIDLHYYKYQEGADKHAQTIPNEENPEKGNYASFDELYESFEDEDNDFCYWTEWEEEFEFEMINGVLTEIEED